MRIFLAIEIPQNIKEKLAAVQEKLRPLIPGVHWEKPEKLHVTLIFLGRVGDERMTELEKTVRKACLPVGRVVKGLKGINVGFSEVGFFPKTRPRVVLLEIGEGRVELERLQKRLAVALFEAGFEFARLSRPHVTIGRFTRQSFASAKFRRVKAVVIMESKLHPAGAIHTPIARIPLC